MSAPGDSFRTKSWSERLARVAAVRRCVRGRAPATQAVLCALARGGRRRPAFGAAWWRSRARGAGVPAHHLEPRGVHGLPRRGSTRQRRDRGGRQRGRVHDAVRAVGRSGGTRVRVRARSVGVCRPAAAHRAQRRGRSRDGGGRRRGRWERLDLAAGARRVVWHQPPAVAQRDACRGEPATSAPCRSISSARTAG